MDRRTAFKTLGQIAGLSVLAATTRAQAAPAPEEGFEVRGHFPYGCHTAFSESVPQEVRAKAMDCLVGGVELFKGFRERHGAMWNRHSYPVGIPMLGEAPDPWFFQMDVERTEDDRYVACLIVTQGQPTQNVDMFGPDCYGFLSMEIHR